VSAPEDHDLHAALAVASRRQLLEALRSAEEPQDVAALAAAVGVHLTTARFHLNVLERAGLVHRSAERASRPGRPRQLYSASAEPEPGEGHGQLAHVLADALAADPDTGTRLAEQAGRRWAEQHVPAGSEASWDRGTREVGDLFGRLGFAPRLIDKAGQRHLELHACPFRDLARSYPQVVCTVHLGLLRGALGGLGVATAERAALRPFVEPELCIADVPFPPWRKTERRPEPAR
jgi:predicted ArsR family transcriptional regulator